MKVTLNVSNNELDALEDQTMCWNLCGKHKRFLEASEADRFNFTQDCRKCRKNNKEIHGIVLHLWSKLVTAYQNASKRKRN